ncbi:hypothetical protein CCR96_14860 [Halochromatium roseum]|nr:hypothetical protein [Halochromatium roseum]
MSDLASLFTLVVVSLGLLFFLAGVVGLLRFPDPLSRLHALTKADALGLGLVVIGLLPQVSWPFTALKLLALWLLMLIGGSIAGQLIVATQFAAEAESDGDMAEFGDGGDLLPAPDDLATDGAAAGDLAIVNASNAANADDTATRASAKAAAEVELGEHQPEDACR